MNSNESIARQRGDWLWPALVASVVFLAICAVILWQSLQLTEGRLTYVIDDAYIHMAIAKNFAFHGVWGVTPYEWTSSDTTFIWPLMLAALIKIFGDIVLWPLLLNVVFSLTTLVFTAWALFDLRPSSWQSRRGSWYILATLLGIILLVPLPSLTFMGMEHVLQLNLGLVLCYLVIKHLVTGNGLRSPTGIALVAIAPLLTSTRYEFFLFLGAAILLLLIRRQWRLALLIALIAPIPPLIYAQVSLAHGWFALPNPLIMGAKESVDLPSRLLGQSFYQLVVTPFRTGRVGHRVFFLFPLLMAFVLLLIDRRKGMRNGGQLAMAFFGLVWLWYLQFMAEGYFYRYEAHVIGLALFAFAIKGEGWLFERQSHERRRSGHVIRAMLLLGVIAIGFGPRAVQFTRKTVPATVDIYQQHNQMAYFVRDYYPEANIVLNDIGAVTYFTDVHLLDLWGLGSNHIVPAYVNDQLMPSVVKDLIDAHDTDLIMIYDKVYTWYESDGRRETLGDKSQRLGWTKVAAWSIPHAVVADETVSFYAISPERASMLEDRLRAYESRLPPDVVVKYFSNSAKVSLGIEQRSGQ